MKCAKRHQQQEKNLDYLSEGFTATLAMGCFAHYDDDVVPGWKRKSFFDFAETWHTCRPKYINLPNFRK